MDKAFAPSSWERAHRLYEKNLELENKQRRSAQAQVPSDPNAWQQIRENYEAIILEDHAFSEKHNIEYALWQLHYKRIEELRAYFNAAHTSVSSKSSLGGKGPVRPDRITKIRLQFKTFLSEATGFYHDLIMNIRAKYGLPLGYFEDAENKIVVGKDGKKSSEMKKGLISCHRCLIYLGDLARYKGLYGGGDSKKREYAAASSYYIQAATTWPSSGNPYHQLALLASYNEDELATVYCYFRSLAVDSPFSTARDNLILAFEKNRQSYSKLSGGDLKAHAVNGMGKGEAKLVTRDTGVETCPRKEGASNIQDTYKSFCTRLVRLNGILFTRTSLETFAEVLSLVCAGLHELLSSGQDEELNFGIDTLENKLAIVRIVSMIIFTVYNVKKDSEGQTYAEILQRAALLQNAFTAAFELMSLVVEKCMLLRDPSCSYLLPGILVFVEWLACYPDIAAGKDEDNQAPIRSKFWNHCLSFLNRLLSLLPMSEDEEETCFNNMSRYEEGETENRLALWEDFELRGFVPLLPAQTILDFSRKNSLGSDSEKERKARVKRILAAGKALANVVTVDQQMIYFDSKGKKFVVGVKPQISDDFVISSFSSTPGADYHQYIEGEDDDEVIVFKPLVAEKGADMVVASSWAPPEGLESVPTASVGDMKFNENSTSKPLNDANHQISLPASVNAMVPQHPPVQPHSLRWLEEELSLANSLKGLRFMENGHMMKPGLPFKEAVAISDPPARAVPTQQSVSTGTSIFYGHDLSKADDFANSFKVDANASTGTFTDNSVVKMSSTLQAGVKKSPVSRPSRHLGPPPGFSHVPLKQGIEPTGSDSISGNSIMDDYSWLDGYQLPVSTKGLGPNGPLTWSQSNSHQVGNNGLSGPVSFSYTGKQIPSLQVEKQNGWQDQQTFELLKTHQNQQLQPQVLTNGNHHFTPLPEQFQGQSIWTGQYFV